MTEDKKKGGDNTTDENNAKKNNNSSSASSWVESGKEYAEKASEQYSSVKSQWWNLRSNLKQTIQSGVEQTNQTLAQLEEQSLEWRKPVVQGMNTVQQTTDQMVTTGWHFYERRHEYGPHIVGASALAMGTLTALRRQSRLAGLVSSILAGGLAYAVVYEPIPLQDIPDLVFGKKQLQEEQQKQPLSSTEKK